MKLISTLILALALSTVTVIAVAAENANTLFQQALVKERTEGNLPEAIKLYQHIVDKFGSNHKVAAEALLQLAGCQSKLGDAQARKSLERLVRDFADQKETVTEARLRLTAMGGGGQKGQQTTRVVWTGDKVNDSGTVSPDGRYLSYTDWKQQGNLAVHDLISGTDRLLTNNAVDKNGERVVAGDSVISRDGRQVAFNWYDEKNGSHYDLRLANLTGDPNPRRLFDNADISYVDPQDWSHDGKWIAVSLVYKDRNSKAGKLGLIAVPDGTLRVLNVLGGPNEIRFSPDGKYLAYDRLISDTGNQRGIYVLTVDGGVETQVASDHSMVGWSPDGKYLLFISDRTGSTGLWELPFANGKAQGQPELVKADIGKIYSMGLSATGAMYYYVPAAWALDKVELATVDISTGKFLTPPVDIAEGGVPESAAGFDWSPDGKSLAYIAWNTSRRYSIKIRTVETGQVRELRSSPKHYSGFVKWAPDGRSLAIIEGGEILRVDAATGEVSSQPLVAKPAQGSISEGSWAPDAKRVYYKMSDTRGDAFVERDLATGADTEVIRRPHLGGLNLSPDGKQIITMLEPLPDNKTMLLIPVDGGTPRELMRLERKGYTLQGVGGWSPDSRSVYAREYVRDNLPGDEEIWQVPTDGGSPRKLDLRLDKHVWGFGLQPGGQRIAIGSSPFEIEGPAHPAEVWVLENFLPVTKAAAAAK